MGIYLLYNLCMSCADAFSMFHSRWYATEFTFVDKLFVILPYVILFVAIAYFFIVIPNSIIKLFRLDKDFDEEKFELNIDKTSILKISVIVIGGIMFVNNLPYVFFEFAKYFQLSVLNINENNHIGWLIYSVVITIIGFLLMTNSKKVVDFIVKKETEKETNNETTCHSD